LFTFYTLSGVLFQEMPDFFMITKQITKQLQISESDFKREKGNIDNLFDFKKKIGKTFNKEISIVLKTLLGGAISLEASDIHLEPEKHQVKLRLRIDGVLRDVIVFKLFYYEKLLSRIKLLSGIKLNIYKQPQNGRFSVVVARLEKEPETIEVRVSTLPAEYGESIVLRILNPKTLLDLKGLGLREDLLKTFSKEIKKPNGMIIVTGPTGSGKSTTLYAILKAIKKPELKIITIEDPIEYHLLGISQTQVSFDKEYNFANGLKSIMRQDPDIILVGEIRDFETAKTALQAALTGHLVLSTLHTNDAAGTIIRLQALGEKPVNIAPAINMTVAQRLVRKLCKKCSKTIFIPKELFKKLEKDLKNIPKELLKIKISEKTKIKTPKEKGCKYCNFTGYRSRTGIFETFLIDDEIQKLILKSPSVSDLKKLAVKRGMISMRQDGLIKVLKGITSIEEIKRVMGE